jgi:hypothetical protein
LTTRSVVHLRPASRSYTIRPVDFEVVEVKPDVQTAPIVPMGNDLVMLGRTTGIVVWNAGRAEVVVEVDNGRPVARDVRVHAVRTRGALRPSDLHLPLAAVIEAIAARATYRIAYGDLAFTLTPIDPGSGDLAPVLRLRRRRRMTDDHLQQVAAVWNGARQAGTNTTKAVQDAWAETVGDKVHALPRTTAIRWIRAAKARGYITT